MPLSETEYIHLLIRESGNNKTLAREAALLWKRRDQYDDMELRYAYVCLDAFKLIMGFTWEEYNVRSSAGEQINASDRFAHLVTMAQMAQAYIDSRLDPQYGPDGSAPQTGDMTATAPLQNPAGFYPDPNETLYQGDPLALWRRRWNA